jgi:integrase/recombinase XerC
MINGFLQYIRYEKNYSAHTVLSYSNDLSGFCDFLKITTEAFTPEAIESEHIRGWVVYLMEAKHSPRTIARKISTLKSFWKYLIKNSIAVRNPALKIILPKTKKPIPVFFREKEVEAIVDDPFVPSNFNNVRDLLIIELLYMTGIRLSELIGIRDSDVNLVQGELKVTGKRNKQRVVPLTVELCERIQHYIDIRDQLTGPDSPSLMVRENGKSLYPVLVYRIVHNRMSAVSSLSRVSPHVMRHSFATAMLNGGADINAVKALLGHSSLAATQVYTHTGFDELHNIYKQAHPRAK